MARKKQISLYIEEDEVSLSLNLESIFGGKITDELIVEDIAQDVIDKMRKRAEKGYGVFNGVVKRFPAYTKQYAAKKGQTAVDLTLSGDMLSAISVISTRPDDLTIGINDENSPKAHGHMTGQYGKGPLPKRPFIGLTSSDIDEIRRKYQKEIKLNETKKASEFFPSEEDKLPFGKEDVLEALEFIRKNGFGR